MGLNLEFVCLFFHVSWISRPDVQRFEPIPRVPVGADQLRFVRAGPESPEQLPGPVQAGGRPESEPEAVL